MEDVHPSMKEARTVKDEVFRSFRRLTTETTGVILRDAHLHKMVLNRAMSRDYGSQPFQFFPGSGYAPLVVASAHDREEYSGLPKVITLRLSSNLRPMRPPLGKADG